MARSERLSGGTREYTRSGAWQESSSSGRGTPGTVQQFVDTRSKELHRGHPVKPKTVRKAVATLRFVWNWAYRRGAVPTKFPEVELVFPKEKQPEPFRTYEQIAAILARGGIDRRQERDSGTACSSTRSRSPRCCTTCRSSRTPSTCTRSW